MIHVTVTPVMIGEAKIYTSVPGGAYESFLRLENMRNELIKYKSFANTLENSNL